MTRFPPGQVLFVERAVADYNMPPGQSGQASVRLTPLGGEPKPAITIPSHPSAPAGQVSGNFDGYEGSLDVGLPVTSVSACFGGQGVNGTTTVLGFLVPAP